MSKTKKSKHEFDIYDDRQDAYLSGYNEGADRVINLLIAYDALNAEFLYALLRDFVTRHNKH